MDDDVYVDSGDVDGGWPGDGSGTDDLADFNANEADDYRDEGAEGDDGVDHSDDCCAADDCD